MRPSTCHLETTDGIRIGLAQTRFCMRSQFLFYPPRSLDVLSRIGFITLTPLAGLSEDARIQDLTSPVSPRQTRENRIDPVGIRNRASRVYLTARVV